MILRSLFTPPMSLTHSSSTMKNLLPGVPLVESPFSFEIFSEPGIDAQYRRIAMDLSLKGYAIIDFPDPAVHDRAEAIKAALKSQFDLEHWRQTDYALGEGLRLQNAWRTNADVKEIACNERILAVLEALYGRKALPFQTLNFPVGTQQHIHTDSVHFSSSPERFMCAVWLALEDTDADNDPLVFFPGSHRWPIYTNEHIGRNVSRMSEPPTQLMYEEMWRALLAANGVQPEYFYAKKGQALIWAANLLHGGARQRDPLRTRWSQVTHYFFEDCAYYTPMMSDTFFGNIAFRKPVNILTGEPIAQQYVGALIPAGVIERTSVPLHDPVEEFDGAMYLEANPDVKKAGWNAAEHYLKHGRKEKRRLRP